MEATVPSDEPEVMCPLKLLAIPIKVGAKVPKNLHMKGDPMEYHP
jgi:hypothetical protein